MTRRLTHPLVAALLGAALTLAHGCASPDEGARPAAGTPRSGPAALDRAFATLAPLVAARGVSGSEGPAADAVRARLAAIEPAWQPRSDEAGNLILELGQGERTLLFVAHLDEIGLIVERLREDGLLEASKAGGFHDHVYQDTAIELVTAGGVLPGIALPGPEVEARAAAAEPPAEDGAAPLKFLIDVGARDADEARALGVAVGDPATVPKELRRLGPHRAAGRSNDDRVGCAALLLALEELHGRGALAALDRRLVFVWATREEVGLLGADHAARTLRPVPEVAFAVDTFVCSDGPRDDDRFAFTALGGGPVLRALDNTSLTPRATLDRVRAVAARHELRLQVGTMGGGNDGSRFVPEGAIDCPLAWPQRASHSRVETFDLRDLVGLSRLVAAVAVEF